MNLPHINKNTSNSLALGPKTQSALTRQFAINRRPASRLTVTDEQDLYNMFERDAILPDPTTSWRTLESQRKNLINLPYSALTEIALDLGPEVNKGLHDFLRFANPSYVLDNENENALRATNEFITKLNTYYGSFRSHLDSMWSGIFMTGGLFLELVLDLLSRNPEDIAVNDPLSAKFRKDYHPVRGSIWRLYQGWSTNPFYLDDNPLVKYIGFDRTVNNPYGRPIIGPAIHSSIFLLGLINDMRRVVTNAGLSRIDYELDAEELLNLIALNPDIAGDDEATAQFINSQIDKVKSVLEGLDVDSDYVHLSTVKVNYNTNPMQINMNGIQTITDTLQRNIVNGFKGISALSNILDSTTETHIRSQVEYYVSSIQSSQNEVSDVLEQFFDAANQVQGIQGETNFKFRKQRTADKKATAEIEQMRTETVLKKLEAQVIDTDEAREEIDSFRDELEVAV